jgi:hypothetical protein
MSNIITKMAMFSLLLNLAAGIMLVAIVDVHGVSVFNQQHTSGLTFDDQTMVSNFTASMEREITPGGSVDDRGNQIYRILDTLGLGFVFRFIEALKYFMFGFVIMLRNLFGPYLSTVVSNLVFGALNTLISISYILAAIKLFTGKDFIEGT